MAYSASPIDFDAGLACNGNNLSFYLGHLAVSLRIPRSSP